MCCNTTTDKSEHHIRPIILKDSFVEDNSGEYYYDIYVKKKEMEKITSTIVRNGLV